MILKSPDLKSLVSVLGILFPTISFCSMLLVSFFYYHMSFDNSVFSSCFILEIGPVTITTDPKKFQSELRELYVQVSNLFLMWF